MYGNIVYNVLSLLQGLESELEGMKKENYLRRLWKKNSTQTKLLDREKAIRAELDSWHVCPLNTVLIDALLTVSNQIEVSVDTNTAVRTILERHRDERIEGTEIDISDVRH